MNKLVLALAAFVAAPAVAQTAPAGDHAMHAGHGDHAAAQLTLDTPIAAIVANEQGKAVLDANLPGLTTHEHYEMFKGMSHNQIAPKAGDKMPADALAKVAAELAKIK